MPSALSRPHCRRSCGWLISGQRCCCSWCWAGNGCSCRDWPWRRFRAWGYFHSGCWWWGPLLSCAHLGLILNGTDEQHHPDASPPWLFRNTPETFGDLSPITRANQNALVDFPHEFVMGKMNDAPLDHDRDLAVLCNAASDLRALQSDVPPRSPTPNAYHTDLARLASAGGA
jgi:hypothetical protein